MTTVTQATIKLENILCTYIRPTFLVVDEYDTGIDIILSCNAFTHMSLQERTSHVFNILERELPDILKSKLVIVQTYNGDEMEQVLDEVFQADD